jgi:hypothetical protein
VILYVLMIMFGYALRLSILASRSRDRFNHQRAEIRQSDTERVRPDNYLDLLPAPCLTSSGASCHQFYGDRIDCSSGWREISDRVKHGVI